MSDVSSVCRALGDATALRGQYCAAEPFPHIVLDNVLGQSVLAQAIAEFPDLDSAQWTNYLHINERKYANPNIDSWGPALQQVAHYFMSPEFIAFVEQLTGIEGLLADPSLDGGGLHRSIHGGFLNIHADFTAHHVHRNWQRRVNLLLYLNDDWRAEYGGDLELWTQDMTHCVERVAPIANRVVMFTTTGDAFHGHPTPLNTPQGVSRKSLALYYFTEGDHTVVRSTNYRARPQDGWRKALIYADKQALHGYDVAKRRLGLSDDFASRVLQRVQRLRRRR